MTILVTLHRTEDLSPAALEEIRALLDLAFEGDFSDDDWHHALGGIHALAYEGNSLVGHGAFVPRTLTQNGRLLRTAYLEALAVHPAHQRRGIGDQLLAALEPSLSHFDLGALSATEASMRLYEKRGWQKHRGPTFATTGRTPDEDGGIYLFFSRATVDLEGPLTCDARSGDAW